MNDILSAVGYSAIFLLVSLVIVPLGWFVLDFMTPNSKLGQRIVGSPGSGGLPEQPGSHSAALVASAWMIMQGLIIFTAVWTNAHGTDFWSALGWTVTYSIVGLVFLAGAFKAVDLITPGQLGEQICEPGPTTALAKLTAANIVAVGIVVIAVIS